MKKINSVLSMIFFSLATIATALFVFRGWIKPLIERERSWRETVYRRSVRSLKMASQAWKVLEAEGKLKTPQP